MQIKWLQKQRYDNEIVGKVGRNTFVVTEKVFYLVCVEITSED
jgi:hypothetical protein